MKYDILQHHGVLGMKWGRRRGQSSGSRIKLFRRKSEQLSTHPIPKKKNTSVDTIQRELAFRKEYEHRDKMSTRQIQQRVNRIKAEQEFNRITAEPFNQRAAAEKAAKDAKRKKMGKAISILSNVPYENFVKANEEKHGGDEAAAKAEQEKIKDMIKKARTATGVAGQFLSQSAILDTPIGVLYEDTLQHHGVLGMKWHQHRAIRNATKSERKSYKLAKKESHVHKKMAKLHRRAARHAFLVDGNIATGRLNAAQSKLSKKQYVISKKKERLKRDAYKKAIAKAKEAYAVPISDVKSK